MPSTATTLTSTHLRSIATDAALTAGDYLASVFRAPMEVQHKTSAHDPLNGYLPNPGDSFVILSAASVGGAGGVSARLSR